MGFIMSGASIIHRRAAFFQLLCGLDYIYSLNIMHRDIKPTNVLVVTPDPIHVVYSDFGSAVRDEISSDHREGTIAYLAPEVLQLKTLELKPQHIHKLREKNNTASTSQQHQTLIRDEELSGDPYTNAVDVFALGLTCYRMMF